MKQLYGLIGYPVGHSLSPLMHNDAFENLGIDAHYEAIQIEPDSFKVEVEKLKKQQIKGFNVTIPYKVDIMDLLDEVDPLARAIGAVNTVVNQNGRYVGYNTDGDGYVASLLQHVGGTLKDKAVAIIGAGGAAKAIFYTLASHKDSPSSFYICNRTVEKAQRLIDQLPFQANASAITLDEAEKKVDTFDVIINTTSVGMHPDVEDAPIDIQHIRPETIVSDIIYNPLETKLLKEAKQKQAYCHNGVGMFVLQGALAFEKWTGIVPDQKKMEQIVLKKLTEK
ncbi:shikimate dehydrogenase [Priestia flexa]|uniref:shikimate dehydrogenase n=1 Tax=Priestia flexa TaxID=86664 RepID=UPI000E684196|nr:shikimate dehydrogenase [Priestia flexa]RIV09098.1 shikimate dehydrogenase [Priestia flexa]